VTVPPLRERPQDIAGLARYFLRTLARESGREVPEISDDTMRLLTRYAWPGNVRELRNAMERAFIMGQGQRIEKALVEAWLSEEGAAQGGPALRVGMTVKDAEETLIRMTLDHFGGHREKTAEALGISVRTLINRLREWRMEANVA
jgi:DNA-binding NtrC family response regulator